VQLGIEYGLTLRFEAFADRGYTSAGYLIPRGQQGDILDENKAILQASAIAQGELRCQRGRKLSLRPDTLCVHGDTPSALAMIKAIRAAYTKGHRT